MSFLDKLRPKPQNFDTNRSVSPDIHGFVPDRRIKRNEEIGETMTLRAIAYPTALIQNAVIGLEMASKGGVPLPLTPYTLTDSLEYQLTIALQVITKEYNEQIAIKESKKPKKVSPRTREQMVEFINSVHRSTTELLDEAESRSKGISIFRRKPILENTKFPVVWPLKPFTWSKGSNAQRLEVLGHLDAIVQRARSFDLKTQYMNYLSSENIYRDRLTAEMQTINTHAQRRKVRN